MGHALELLDQDETSPCVDFDQNHPLAIYGMALALSMKPVNQTKTLAEILNDKT